jgi:hypothetical protein
MPGATPEPKPVPFGHYEHYVVFYPAGPSAEGDHLVVWVTLRDRPIFDRPI